jgi:hypothetical protein
MTSVTGPSELGRQALAASLAASRERNLAIIGRAAELDDQAVSLIAAQVAGALAGREPQPEPQPSEEVVTWSCSRCACIEVSVRPSFGTCPACMAGEPFWLPPETGLPRCHATDLGSCCNSQRGHGGALHVSWSRGVRQASWPAAPEFEARGVPGLGGCSE